MLKKGLFYILKKLAVSVLKKYKPKIVAVTGSMGKTSTKEAIFAVLNSRYKARRNIENYNNEIGVPLTILGEKSGEKSLFKWAAVFLRSLSLVFFKKEYPEILILEMGADKPGDIKYLMSFIDPNAGVITGIGDIPVHIEFFGSPAQVMREKAKIIEFLKEDDFAILNFDDERVRNLAKKTKAKVLGYGFIESAKIKAGNYELNIGLDPTLANISFKIEYEGKTMPLKAEGMFAQHQVYPMLAACAVGLCFNLNLMEILNALKSYQSPKGRMILLEGIKSTWILDDSYNASPTATISALETLAEFDGRRKIAVLGDMLELGEFTEEAHQKVGEKTKETSNFFFAVGERMRFAAEAARKKGMSGKKIFWFETSDAARLPLQKTIQKGDVILIKGSQAMRMEKIVEEIMAHPERAAELLVRQDKKWKG